MNNNCNNKCGCCPAGQTPYTIRGGDTLWAIARNWDTTVDDILAVNPGIDPDNLQIGQKICLPFTGEIYPMCRTGNYYVVRRGAGISTIAAYFGVTADMITKNNMGIDPDNLYEGQVLCIPVAPSPVRVVIGGGELKVLHKNGGETSCKAEGELNGDSCVVTKQLDIGVSGARILNLANGGAISGRSSGYGGIVIEDSDMDALFNLVPVGASVEMRR